MALGWWLPTSPQARFVARRKARGASAGPNELRIPAIEGTGGLHIYLVDRYGAGTIYDVDSSGSATGASYQHRL
jgi:4-hydroxyphenylpyruvate dioxygenase-like putative hemolysin